MSPEFIKKCKDDIAQFGFDGLNYSNFLVSVWAMRNQRTVLKLPVSEMDDYYNKFLKKNESEIDDAFALNNFKQKSDDGYFIPRAFWDYIRDYKLSS